MPFKTAKTLSSTDAAYIAGLVDGEGTIDLAAGKLRLSITQAEKGLAMLKYVKTATGVGCIYVHRKATGNWQTVYRYQVASNHIVPQIWDQIAPYLTIKRLPNAKTT